MTITTEDGGRTNVYAKEPKMYTMAVSYTHLTLPTTEAV